VGRAFSRVCLFVCLFVRALIGKQLELSTPNLVHVPSIAVARHALAQRSKGQRPRSRSRGYENRHGRTVASDSCCYGRCACRFDCRVFSIVEHAWCMCRQQISVIWTLGECGWDVTTYSASRSRWHWELALLAASSRSWRK